MGFLGVPNEVVLLVVTHLDFDIDINSLCRTNWRLYTLLIPILYKHCVAQKKGGYILGWAAERGLVSTGRLLMEAGVPPDAEGRDDQYWSPFPLAVSCGHKEMVQLLYEYGIDPCFPDTEWRNLAFDIESWWDHEWYEDKYSYRNNTHPLLLAAENGDISVVKLLLGYGVQPGLCKDGRKEPTALCSAAKGGSLDTARLFVDAGCLVNVQGQLGDTPLTYAVQNGDLDMVQFLLSCGADPNSASSIQRTSLYVACFSGNIDIVRCLLDYGASLNPTCQDGQDPFLPLYRAARKGHHDIVDLLLARFDYIKCCTDYLHRTVLLCIAAMTGRTALLTDLLTKHNFDPNSRVKRCIGLDAQGFGDVGNQDALAWATKYNQITAMDILLSHGAHTLPIDPKYRYDNPRDFFYAIKNGDTKALETLFAHKFDLNKPSDEDLERAISHPPMFSLLLSHGAVPNAEIFYSALHFGVVDTVKILLDLPRSKEQFIDPLEASSTSSDPHQLFYVALCGGEKKLRLLLDRGLVTAPEKFDHDEAHKYIRLIMKDNDTASPTLFRLFLSLKFDELVTYYAFDLVYCAATSRENFSGEFLDILQEHGVDLETKDDKGRTPLIRAAIFCNGNAIRRLMERGADPLTVYKGKTALIYLTERYYGNYGIEVLLRYFDEKGYSFGEIEGVVRSAKKLAQEKAAEDEDYSTRPYRLLYRFYWRGRYPVP